MLSSQESWLFFETRFNTIISVRRKRTLTLPGSFVKKTKSGEDESKPKTNTTLYNTLHASKSLMAIVILFMLKVRKSPRRPNSLKQVRHDLECPTPAPSFIASLYSSAHLQESTSRRGLRSILVKHYINTNMISTREPQMTNTRIKKKRSCTQHSFIAPEVDGEAARLG